MRSMFSRTSALIAVTMALACAASATPAAASPGRTSAVPDSSMPMVARPFAVSPLASPRTRDTGPRIDHSAPSHEQLADLSAIVTSLPDSAASSPRAMLGLDLLAMHQADSLASTARDSTCTARERQPFLNDSRTQATTRAASRLTTATDTSACIARSASTTSSDSDRKPNIPPWLGGGLVIGALAADRNTTKRMGSHYNRAVAAAKHIFAGGIVVRNAAGYAEPGTTAVGKVALGIAQDNVDNTAGANGDQSVDVDRGVFHLKNDGSVDITKIGTTCYIVDDETVAAADGGGTRSAAGTIRDVDATGVWVEF